MSAPHVAAGGDSLGVDLVDPELIEGQLLRLFDRSTGRLHPLHRYFRFFFRFFARFPLPATGGFGATAATMAETCSSRSIRGA